MSNTSLGTVRTGWTVRAEDAGLVTLHVAGFSLIVATPFSLIKQTLASYPCNKRCRDPPHAGVQRLHPYTGCKLREASEILNGSTQNLKDPALEGKPEKSPLPFPGHYLKIAALEVDHCEPTSTRIACFTFSTAKNYRECLVLEI